MRSAALLLLSLVGCAALEPAQPGQTVYIHSPYAPGSQPNPIAVDLGPPANSPETAAARQPPPIMNPQNPGLPVPRTRRVEGPATVCKGGLVIDLLAGEQLSESNAGLWLKGESIDLSVDAWIYELPRDSAFLRAAGSVSAPGLGELERVEVTRRNPSDARFIYVLDTGQRGMFPLWGIRSNQFDGGPKDLSLLSRLRLERDDEAECSRL